MDPNKQALNPLAAIITIIVLIGIVYLIVKSPAQIPTPSKDSNTTTTTPDTNSPTITKAVNTTDEPFIGKEGAPLIIAYWSDYQCPFCKKFETETMPDIIKNYVNTGKAKIVFKDLQFLGRDSTIAGLYARAVWELYPNKYFIWREAMFDEQDRENDGFGDQSSIEELTGTIAGMDVAKLADLVRTKKAAYQQKLDADKSEGKTFSITATPGILVGTKVVSGAVSYDDIKLTIESELNK